MSQALVEIVRRHTDASLGDSPYATAIKGLLMLRADLPKHPSHLLFRPCLCVVVQGAKCTVFGERRFDYRAGQALVVSVDMPALSRVSEASPQEPYLGLVIELDLALMREVFEELDPAPKAADPRQHGVFVTDFEGPLADCVLRLLRLLDTPRAISMLSPMIMREICYWLLSGPQGGEVARMALANQHAPRIIHAIYALREQFKQAVRIEQLAAIARLSPSAFHRQFKALTSMTPLQYQKQLRLLEARQLLSVGLVNAEAAAFQVGYESPSQFSREYARMFGAPPRRDIAAVRAASA